MSNCDVVLIWCLTLVIAGCVYFLRRPKRPGPNQFKWGEWVEVTSGEYAGLVYQINNIHRHPKLGWAYTGKTGGKNYTFYANRLTRSRRV